MPTTEDKLKFEQAVKEFSEVYHNDVFALLKSIPIQEFWRFLTDGRDQKKSQMNALSNYEMTEKGYLLSITSAFKYMLDTAKQTPYASVDLIKFSKELHYKALEKVEYGTNYHNKCNKLNHDECLEKAKQEISEFRPDNSTQVGMRAPQELEEGIKEILQKIVNRSHPWLELTYERYDTKKRENTVYSDATLNKHNIRSSLQIAEVAKKIVDRLEAIDNWKMWGEDAVILKGMVKSKDREGQIAERAACAGKLITYFQKQIQDEKEPFGKFQLIVNFIHDMEQLHPFKDGNGRTFVTLLQLYLLLVHRLPPIILFNPNDYDFHSNASLLKQAIEGMNNVLSLAKNKELYGFKTQCERSTLEPHVKYAFCQSMKLAEPYFSNSINEKDYFDMLNQAKEGCRRAEEKAEWIRKNEIEEDEKCKLVVLAIENYILNQKPWTLSLFGGIKHPLDNKQHIKMPHHFDYLLKNSERSKKHEQRREKPHWQFTLGMMLNDGVYAFTKSKSKDKKRKEFYSLFSANNKEKFCKTMGIDEKKLDEVLSLRDCSIYDPWAKKSCS